MSDRRELGTKIRQLLHECAGWDADQISQDRVEAIGYYFQRERGDEAAGRSNVIANDISSMVEANLAQMLESFSSWHLAEFDAAGPGDDDQAELESFTVSKFLWADNNGYNELGTAIKDSLLLRNGWLKIWVEEEEGTQTLELENATPEAIAELRASPGMRVELLEYDSERHYAKLRVTKTALRFRNESIDPANMLYLPQWNKSEAQETPFIAERHIEPRSKLLERGFPKSKVNRLKRFDWDTKLDSLARDVKQIPQVPVAVDKSQELIEWFECYVLMDSGDGTSERRRISVSGVNQDSILEDIPHSLVPYATGSPFIAPHRLTGISLFDKLKQQQDKNTSLERALLDNVNSVIKSRTAYLDGKVNTEDLADGRPNGNIRVRASVGNVQNAITTFSQPDISGGILKNLEYQKQNRTELGGASLELATGNMQMSGGRIGSEGVDRAFSVMEQLASHMTKNLASTLVRGAYLIGHAMLRQFFDQPVNLRLSGRWLSPIPAQWQPRTSVTVKIGMSPGERARKIANLRGVVDSQIALAREGMDEVLVNIDGFYKALTDLGRAAELPNPEQYFLDPASDASQEALNRKRAAQQAEQQKSAALMSQAVGLEQLRAGLDKYKADQETTFKVWAETLRAEIEEAKIAGKATADLIAQTRFNGSKSNGSEKPTESDNATANGGAD